MTREFYKMYHKNYLFALFLLLLLPFLFGIGSFFDLPYMTEDMVSASAFDYCAEMQALEKYFYFLAAIYLASDYFTGEQEEGQLRLEFFYLHNRKKLLLRKILAYAALLFFFQFIFWGFNCFIYAICDGKSTGFLLMQPGRLSDYLAMFFGYWEMLLLCGSAVMLSGLFLKKVHALVLVYFLWFALRYVDELASLKNILPEFTADFLMEHSAGAGGSATGCLVGGILIFAVTTITFLLFERRDIS